MKRTLLTLSVLFGAVAGLMAANDSIPERAIILSGDATHPDNIANIAEMYNRENTAFSDPAAPRFLFLDKKGKVALGIGGHLKAEAAYDMDGAINNNSFVTADIPVPFNPAQRNRLGATANHSKLFLKMVSTQTPVGRVIVYLETEFTGDGGNYGLMLKQAYVSVGHITLGKARSTFADAEAMAPTVDDQGPCGQVNAKNMLVRYTSPSYKGFTWAVSAELPKAGYTLDGASRAISQRFPDIPAYIQYSWTKGSHVRVSGILRELSYRNLATAENHFKTGYGVQFSAIAKIYGPLSVFGHYTFGEGIANYVNDLGDFDIDLVAEGGKVKAKAVNAWTAGLSLQATSQLMFSGSYSRAQVNHAYKLGPDAYRYGQYIAVNAFYSPWKEVTIGLEYLHGTRKDASGDHGRANRIDAMLQYSF